MSTKLTNSKQSFLIYAATSLVNILFSYWILLLITRHLSKEDYAQYGYFYSLFSLLLILFNFGAKEAVFKLTSTKNKQAFHQVWRWFSTWQIILLSLTGILLFANFPIGVVTLNFILMSQLLVVNAINRGNEKYLQDALSLPIQRGVWIFFLAAALITFNEVSHIDVFATSAIGTFIAILLLMRKSGKFRFSFHIKKPPKILVKFFLVEASILAYTRVDMLLLKGKGVPDQDIADYFLSVQIFDVAVLLLAPISYFFFNEYAKKIQKREPVRLSAVLGYFAVLLFLVFFGQSLWWLAGAPVLEWMFPKYVASGEIISLFIWALYPLVINFLLSSYLILHNYETHFALVCFCALLCYMIAANFLIPEFQGIGAVYSRIITETVICLSLASLVAYLRKSHVQVNSV